MTVGVAFYMWWNENEAQRPEPSARQELDVRNWRLFSWDVVLCLPGLFLIGSTYRLIGSLE
jgi:hypothetical protein